MTNMTIEQFYEAADRLENGFAVYDQDLNLIFVNKQLAIQLPEMFAAMKAGESYTDALNKQIDAIMPDFEEEARREFIELSLRAAKTGESYKTKGANGRFLKIQHGQTSDGMVVGISIDLTEERKRSSELKKARKVAEAASAAKSEFLAAMSHEIRTPLNGILGMAQALGARDLSADEQDMVSTILESSKSLMTILNEILDLSKIEAGKMELAPIGGDLRHKLTRLQKFYTPTAEKKDLYLKLVVAPNVPGMLVFDPVRVRQAVSNLISNALKFTHTGGVLVAVKSTPLPKQAGDHMVTIHVSDSGIGITKEQRSMLFNDFAQADSSTTRRFGGTGLGLAIAQRLARMMGGGIKVASEPGKGSVFTFTFKASEGEAAVKPSPKAALELVGNTSAEAPVEVSPIASEIPPAAAPVAKTEPKPGTTDTDEDLASEWIEESTKRALGEADANAMVERSTNSLRGIRTLIVDDNAVNRRVARLLVEPQGLIATEVENGREALDALAKKPFDLVLLDMHMPVMDGREAIKILRQSKESWSKIPVIALTADAMSGDREKCLDLGMDGYVPKPVDQRELFVEILEVMRKSEGRISQTSGAALVDPVVTLDSQELSLDDLFDIAETG